MAQQIRFFIKSPDAVDREVRLIISKIFPDFNFEVYSVILNDVIRLFEGKMSGFSGCDTEYHDLSHTMSTLLATARLLHGVHVERKEMSHRLVYMTLISALYHDTGYIRRLGENKGTGAQFTVNHVQRSIDMLKATGTCYNWPDKDVDAMAAMIQCTESTQSPTHIHFPDEEARLGGHILATADVISQMADDVYLERLQMLYREFAEAGISEFQSEYDLVNRTKDFCAFMLTKMRYKLSNVIECMGAHFREEYGVDRDLYSEAVKKNMEYLGLILKIYGEQYRKGLRRAQDRKPHPLQVAA